MPASWSELNSDIATLNHTFPSGNTLTIVYRPSQVTPEQIHRLQELNAQPFEDLSRDEQDELIDSTPRTLSDIVIRWDLLAEDGTPVDPTVDGLKKVPLSAQRNLVKLIAADQQSPKSNGSEQYAGSSMPLSVSNQTPHLISPPSPTGISPSPSQDGLTSPFPQ